MKGPVTVWQDYRTDGWQPTEFPDVESALEFIQQGSMNPFRITREMTVGAWVPANTEVKK